MAVILIGTLDTKGTEIAFLRDRLRNVGIQVLVMDAGTSDPQAIEPEISRHQVFEAAGTSMKDVLQHRDRGRAVADASRGVRLLIEEMLSKEEVEGILAIGGSAGTTIGTSAMRASPFGIPKLMVSTLASGQTRPYVGGSDIMMIPSIADLAGLNRVTRQVLGQAANAMVGMVRATPRMKSQVSSDEGPLITATMFGVTTPCVDRARHSLEAEGAEVIVFHATGVGGQAMERLIRDGIVTGVLDLTTTEIADELVGGVLSAGPDRLKAAIEGGVPQVVSVGALDMVNFGPIETVPDRFRSRRLHRHNPSVTLARTLPEECEAIGRRMAEVLCQARASTAVLIPELGISALDAPGKPFYDLEANQALTSALQNGLVGSTFAKLESVPMHINDPEFADLAVSRLWEFLNEAPK